MAYKNNETRRAHDIANKERLSTVRKAWYEKNKVHKKEYQQAHKEDIAEKKKAYHQENKEDFTKVSKAWRDNNLARVGVHGFNKRTEGDKIKWNDIATKEQDALDKIYTRRDMLNEYNVQYEVDHILSIANGGLHNSSNLQLLSERANKIKG